MPDFSTETAGQAREVDGHIGGLFAGRIRLRWQRRLAKANHSERIHQIERIPLVVPDGTPPAAAVLSAEPRIPLLDPEQAQPPRIPEQQALAVEQLHPSVEQIEQLEQIEPPATVPTQPVSATWRHPVVEQVISVATKPAERPALSEGLSQHLYLVPG